MSDFGAPEYLGHQLLLRLQEQRGLVPKTVLHKLWCISDRHLEETHDVDLELPRYWYMYGEMVDEASVNSEFHSGPQAPWGGQAYKPDWDLETDDFDVEDDVREHIDKTVKWTINRFDRRETPYLESYQYQIYAPNDFVRAYSELRAHLQYVNLEIQEVLTQHAVRPDFDAEDNRELVESYLDELVITYPEQDPDFADLQPLFLRWDDTARLILETETPFEDVEALLDEFIEALSVGLLQVKYNEDVPSERIEEWEEESEGALGEFERSLESTRKELLLDREPSGILERHADAYDDIVVSDLEN